MIELLINGVIFLGQVFFIVVATNIIFNLVTRKPDSTNYDLEQKILDLQEKIHQVKVEKHQDMLYWFDEDDDEFLGQGKDIQDIIHVLKSRFSEHIFLVSHQDSMYSLYGPDWKLVPIDQIIDLTKTVDK